MFWILLIDSLFKNKLFKKISKKKVDVPAKRLAIILNHEKFKTRYPDRLGTDRDVENLKSVLCKLGFQCLVYNDLTANEIMDLRLDLQKKNIFSNIDSLLIFVLSYGSSSNNTEASDKSYNLLSFIDEFRPTVLQEMRDKPKLFFICTSRNKNTAPTTTMYKYGKYSYDTDSVVVDEIERHTPYNNLVVLYGTTEYSFRDSIHGTHFIQAFVETSEHLIRDEKQNKLDIMDFYHILNNSLVKRSSTINGKQVKQVAQIYSTLHEPYYFEKTE